MCLCVRSACYLYRDAVFFNCCPSVQHRNMCKAVVVLVQELKDCGCSGRSPRPPTSLFGYPGRGLELYCKKQTVTYTHARAHRLKYLTWWQLILLSFFSSPPTPLPLLHRRCSFPEKKHPTKESSTLVEDGGDSHFPSAAFRSKCFKVANVGQYKALRSGAWCRAVKY